ncbi:MAG: flagellar motor switch protein FliN [Phycisphaeraceae bacterium]|nr:flagellar motor switch protein FliN [Phycisphaeraceae bacterium]
MTDEDAANTAPAGQPAVAPNQDQGEPVGLPVFEQGPAGDSHESQRPIDMLADVDLDVRIELGRTHMLIEDVLSLAEGAVVELDKLAGDPVDVYVNERLVARGEVLVLNDNFCVRVSEIVDGAEEVGDSGEADSSDPTPSEDAVDSKS